MPADHSTNTRRDRKGVFISYARSDCELFAAKLRERLKAEGIEPWRDRDAMEGGRDWWLQITEALDQVQFMALVVTQNALKSEPMTAASGFISSRCWPISTARRA